MTRMRLQRGRQRALGKAWGFAKVGGDERGGYIDENRDSPGVPVRERRLPAKGENVAVKEQNVEIDGLPIRYLSAGEGLPMVLLHGAGDSSLDWRWVIPDLAATHRVYAPDLPGSPDSARPAAAYSPAFFERFAVGFLNALGIGRATFVGNSLGGLIALRLALSEPARVTALVLVDSAGLGSAVNPAF